MVVKNKQDFFNKRKGILRLKKSKDAKKKINGGVATWGKPLCLCQWQLNRRDWHQPQEIH